MTWEIRRECANVRAELYHCQRRLTFDRVRPGVGLQ